MSEYIFPLTSFPNDAVDLPKLMVEIRSTAIAKAIDYVDKNNTECLIYFKADLDPTEHSTLSGVVQSHDGVAVKVVAPTMADGRPIVRADTRPLNTQTYFTSSGDNVTASGSMVIGNGQPLRWDFSNSDNDITIISGTCDYCEHDMSGFKGKVIDLVFVDPVWPKDGAMYFFDAPWGCYVEMQIVCPPGMPYKDPNGTIPASAIGASGNEMYTIAVQDTVVAEYVHKHYLTGTCTMGDELNAEGATVEAIPPGYIIRGLIFTPDTDSESKGYASFELYRERTVILPGESV